jgi:uncharacterized protein YdbL (DUF1318 family)
MTDTFTHKSQLRFSPLIMAATLILGSAAGGLVAATVSSTPATASTATAKALIDAAKAAGKVGEQGDGFIGFVSVGPVGPDLQAAVDEINAGRAAVYRETAAKTGVTPDAAGQAVATQLINKMPPGQFYRPLGGAWTRK